MSIHYNAEQDCYELIVQNEIFQSIPINKIDDFLEGLQLSINAAKAERNVHLVTSSPMPKETIPLEYLYLDVVQEGGYEINDIIGLKIEMGWDSKFQTPEVIGVYAMLKDGKDYYIEQGISKNFTTEQFQENGVPVSNIEISRCLEQDFIDYIKERPHFKLVFCDQEIPHDTFFNTKNPTFFRVMKEDYFL